jgi:hypothetical protein
MVWGLGSTERRRKGKEFCIMRKMILALVVVLITAPAWADVQIILEDEGDGVISVSYDSSGEAELVRAFALDLTVTEGEGTLVDVTDYVTGDDNGGYGIFPANFSRYITVDGQTGEVADWGAAGYTPVADANDTGAAGGLGGTAITIEMGSLYDTQAPGTSGLLCKIAYEGSGTLCATANAVRGGIVLEDASQATLASDCIAFGGDVPCFPSTNPQYNTWVALGKPECWCNPYQCDGDIDGKDSGGFAKQQVSLADLNILVNNWQKKASDPTLDPCADLDHQDSGGFAKQQVSLADLNILVNNWQKKASQLPGDCPR